MTNCVTQTQKNSKEYKSLMDKFNLSSSEVEMLLHEYQNNPENEALIQAGEIFPSESYMQEHIYGPAFSVSNNDVFQKLLEVWEKNFSTPVVLNNKENAEQVANIAAQSFTAESVRIRETKDGKWQVLVTKPQQGNDIQENKTTEAHLTVKEFLKQAREIYIKEPNNARVIQSLVHSFKDKLWLPKLTRIDTTTSNLVYDTKLAKSALENFIKLNGLKDVVTIKDNLNSSEVIVNEDNLADYIEESANISDLFEDSVAAQQTLDILNFLKGKFGISYKVITENEAKKIIKGKQEGNSFYNPSDNTAYFIKGRKLNANIAAEEMLHPFIGALHLDNSELFAELLADAKQLYPKLRLQIEKAYRRDGEDVINEEIVTQALSRAVVEDRKNNPKGNKISDLLAKFSEWLVNLFSNSPTLNFDKELLTIDKLAAVINSEIQLEYRNVIVKPRYNISNNSIDQQFKESQDVLRTQLDAIYGIDSEFSAEEFRQIAQDIVYAISDIITEVEKNPELILKYNSAGKAENISGLSRREILGQIGVDNVVEYLKLNNFDASVNPNIVSFEDIDKAEIIVDNMDAFLTKGAPLFMQLEGFKITKNHTVSDEIDATVEDLDPNSVTDELEEIGGNEQENWGIDKRTEAAFDKASTLVKQALTQCYKLNPDGTPVVSQWGIKQRLDAREATQSILKWTQGALSLSSMITKLEEQAKKNPWVQPIINRLKDKSGKDTSFQSQFFGVMSRYFQLYSVGKKQGKKYSVFEVNTHPALTEAKRGISGMYNAGVHPLFDSNGRVNTTALEQLKGLWESLKDKKYTLEIAEELSETLSNVSALLGYPISAEAIVDVLNASSFAKMTTKSLQFIIKSLEDNKDNSSWQPFSGDTADNGIINNIGKFISPITERLEDTTNTSFYDSGNMYQSYVTPSYVTKLIQKFSNSTQEDYNRFIQYEYGKYRQFKDDSGWRNSWLELLDTVEGARHILTHKVQLNFDGNRFMINRSGLKAMSDAELTLSIVSEYFKENGYNTKNEIATSWFRIPLMSNKPSSEFIKFYSYRGANYKNRVLNGCMQLFGQELSRIQTVKKRNEQFSTNAPERINNFDKRGLKFCFFDFLNSVDNERFHTLVDKVTSNTSTEGEVNELSVVARDLIKEGIEKEWAITRESWRNQGIIEAAKSIKGINEESVESALENFFWNDFLASNNILNLTITDLAYYKNTEDVQKRLAQLHAPGIRANIEATDFDGNRVADSKTRTVYLKDVEINPKTLKSNIIENVKVVFNRKLKEIEGQPQYEATKALYNSIIEDFEDGINVADAQGYASPTSYRKKAFVFGKWDAHSEELYQKLVKGDYNFTDLKTAFQPLKPFVYTQIEKDSGVDAASLPTLKMGVQNKNSEYLLIMAGAIVQNEETGMPNYLRAIYDVMEESHKGKTVDGKHVPRVDGIDTIQFESTVKAGLTGVIDITQATSTEDARQLLNDLIYTDKENHLYDKTHVQELEFEDYSIQQEIPAHFRDHEQQQGSQIRMITVSDLNPNVKYKVEGRELSAEEFRKEYEDTIADNIKESIQELIDEFHLNPGATQQEKNIALARVLQDEILSSPRYGLDLLMSCMLDENGKFIIPLGDSTQSKRIEQLINSIVKNRINKQKIAGGPVVQVSNFGTSRQLSIRFKDRNGNLLESLSEHLEKGGTEESWIGYIKENQGGVAYYEAFVPAYMQDIFRDFMDAQGNIDTEAIEQNAPELLQMIGYRIPSEDKYSMIPMRVVGFLPKEAGDGVMLPYEITLITGSDFDIDKMYLMRKDIPIVLKDKKEIRKALKDKFDKDRYDDINIFLDQITDDTQRDDAKASYPDLWKEYVKVAYKAKPHKEGRIYRNNKVIDMTWEVLTHEDTANKLLNPGGFEEQKHEGYLVQAARLTGQPISELEKLTTSELKDKCQSTKNLAFISAHTQYYKQNAAAGSILAIFAVAKVAHACLESNGFTVDVQQVCRIDTPVSVLGLTLFDKMELDPQKDSEGNFIGKTLGSLVASAADAVKDPILNLMNINSDTVNILNTLIRLGMPFRKAARLLSTQVVSDLLTRYNTEKLSETTTFNRTLDKMLTEISVEHGNLADSQLITEDLTEEEVNDAVLNRTTASDYKILLALQRVNQINSAMRSLNFATRFNSISSAVGPLIIDNLKIEHNLDNFAPGIFTKDGTEAGFDDVFTLHPILKGFSDSVELAKKLFGTHMPTNSNQFRHILNVLNNTTLLNAFYRDRSIFSKFSDFYQTYLLTFNNVVSSNPATVRTYLTEFPAEFAKNEYKSKYAGNPFIEAIRFDTDNNSKNPVLKINITGLDAEAKSKLTSGWLDLYKSDEEGKALAGKLFNYWFYKGGIGYNPTNPISLLPIQLRQRLKRYKATFEKLPDISAEDVVNQFIRNNWEDNDVAPYRKFDKPLQMHDGGYVDFYEGDAARLNNILAFKTKIGNETALFIRDEYDINDFGEVRIVYKQTKPLGNNGEFVEITPVSTLNSVLETPTNPIAASESLNDVVPTEITEEEVERTISEDEARKEAQKLIDAFLTDADKEELKKQNSLDDAKRLITEKLKEKGVTVNEKQVEEIAKQYC